MLRALRGRGGESRASKRKAGSFCTEIAQEGGGEERLQQEKGGLCCVRCLPAL